MKNIFRRKSIDSLIAETKGKESLEKVLGSFELTMLGIGAIVGTGIFVLTGIAAANYSGPALVISFMIAGLACGFAALCYSEIAAMIPVAGSAYTYGYAALGEFWAWVIGWDLILEYAFAIGTVAIGWSGYFNSILESLGATLPAAITKAPFEGGFINLPAVLILVVITGVLIVGVKQSTTTNNIIVFIKLAVVLLFIVLGIGHVNPVNWHPFMPYGWKGVFAGASVIFFAYIGFDAVSTAAEEVKNPQKDLPRGIISSLIICTILYILVSAILTGMVPYFKFKNTAAPVAFALQQVGYKWGSALISVGAICGLTSVLIVMMFGQTRILFAMSRDGLLPKVFGHVNLKFHTPVKSTLLVGIITMAVAGFTPIGIVSELTNVGTLAAFIIVSASVIVLRRTEPDRERSFKVPFSPVVPLLAIISCSFLVAHLQKVTLMRFVVWLAFGLIIYFVYGYKHSTITDTKVNNQKKVI
ncbi:MAG TPA: amino acid permease [Clostridium sp.]|jgi:APA family basic amino acid/polyamine antiporter|uniref:Amino acid permease n=1 Tax=Clostridium lapidicellarium TaxID=3240931 RepID=A0ABV4E0H8_9CLOT|nr:amino acid permease [uncultured Clostridium sp.]NLU09213.1 amino acid permease [Clostridiales bacterium]HBC98006.1 amino acid permease [Clostridium sp.]